MKTFLKIIAIVLLVAAAIGLGFLTTAGIYKLFCMAFGFKFTWLRALAIWLIWVSIAGLAKSHAQAES